MYGLINRELNDGTIFNFYLNDQGGFKVCEMVQQKTRPKYIFFDDLDDSFESAVSDLQMKIYAESYEHFHYEQITRNIVVISKQERSLVYVCEFENYNDSFYDSGKFTSVQDLIKVLNFNLKKLKGL